MPDENAVDPLFPELPEDLKGLSDEDLASLLEDHEQMATAIAEDDSKFLEGLSADEFLNQYRSGKDQLLALRSESEARTEAHENFKAELDKITSEVAPPAAEVAEEDESAPDNDDEEQDGAVVEETEKELVLASADSTEGEVVEESVVEAPIVRFSRRPPAPAPERMPAEEPQKGAALVASGDLSHKYQGPLDSTKLAELVKASALHHGPMPKTDQPGRYRFGGPEHKIAYAEFEFPPDRDLTDNVNENIEKIRGVVVESSPFGAYSLTASGGLCAPLEPIYTMPNFASEAEPVWDSLPVFRARRGGVNVPAATYIADITTAISSISEENDALGGTFATKSCQALDCPDYTEVAVNIIAHCREYGNLNARAWPEKIAHENALTMAAMARTSETFILDRIKALSINVTQAEILGAYADLVHALTKAAAGIRYRLRMARGARFNVVLPEWVAELLAADVAMTQFDRYQAQAAMIAHLESLGFRVTLYKDPVTGGTSQGFAAEAAGALDDFPDDVQYAIFPEGQFIGIDSGTLELGIVRDSVLNATNDFQVFGERFRNLAMLGPAQGALWVTQGICPSGEFPALGTALTC